MRIDEAGRARVAQAITAAEATTDGEVAAIVAPASDNYVDVVLHWALLATLLALALVTARPGVLVLLRALPDGGWAAEYPLGQLLAVLIGLLVLVFLLARLVFGLAAVRRVLTPGATQHRRVRRRAEMLFRAGTERRTASRTGVLLYLSLAERRAEIVADRDIAAKVSPDRWGEAMAALLAGVKANDAAGGMADAIGRIGAVLAEAFPHTGTDPNELPDRLIEL